MAALATAAVVGAVAMPAQAMTPRTSGWKASNPPADLARFAEAFPSLLYTVSCRGVTATGWSAGFQDDPVGDWDTILFTTAEVGAACEGAPLSVVVRQGDQTFVAAVWLADASGTTIAVQGDHAASSWDFVPTPRVGQWVAVAARAVDGAPLPMIQSHVTSVGDSSFSVATTISAEYAGAPVLDNTGRALGFVSRGGTEISGTPAYCESLVPSCTDPSRVWWDITAPSAVRQPKATGAKGSVTVTWKPVASTGGAPVTYNYSVNGGAWLKAPRLRVVIPAAKGTVVTVVIQAINQAGYGPSRTVVAEAR